MWSFREPEPFHLVAPSPQPLPKFVMIYMAESGHQHVWVPASGKREETMSSRLTHCLK